ncbi:adenylate kinase-domain-containing protein [Pyronema omphalodes]|nr:adenylate kinase-domain-containing protein [Pyronema omphalodes]
MSAPSRILSSVARNTARFSTQTRAFHRVPVRTTTATSRASQPRVPARSYASQSGGSKNPFPVLPLLAIFAAGSGAFYMLVQQRKEPMPAIEEIPAPASSKPTFSPKEVSVIFVLGGPGAGKGTQCANLVRDFGFVHLSAGDLLREEQNREGSEFGELIKTYIREGKIVPMEVTVALLENAMKDSIAKQGKRKFLIDGFPRKLDQAHKFEDEVCPSAFTLFFDCPEEVMLQRLLKRGETSGRIDDNIESIKKRFQTFRDTSYPVVEYFRAQGKVIDVVATSTPEGVYEQVKKELVEKLNTAKA